MGWLPAASWQLPEAAAGLLRASLPGRTSPSSQESQIGWCSMWRERNRTCVSSLEFKRAAPGSLRAIEEQHLENHPFLIFLWLVRLLLLRWIQRVFTWNRVLNVFSLGSHNPPNYSSSPRPLGQPRPNKQQTIGRFLFLSWIQVKRKWLKNVYNIIKSTQAGGITNITTQKKITPLNH